MNHVDYLEHINACSPGVEYAAKYPSLREAWEKCDRPDWMIWLLRTAGIRDARRYRLFACWCVRNTPIGDGRTMWDLLTDERSRNAVIVAERFAHGHATRGQLAYAAAAAEAAAAAFSATAYATAAEAAAAAFSATAYAAAAAAAAAAFSATAAYAAAKHFQANKLREMFAEEFDRIEAMADREDTGVPRHRRREGGMR